MLKGKIRLMLMIGPVVPVPAPKEVMDALTEVTVTSSTDQGSGFQLSFTLSNRSPLHTLFVLAGGAMPPIMRVLILAIMDSSPLPEVLFDGVMTNHQVTPGTQPGQSVLTVTGRDLSTVMNYIEFTGLPYPAMPYNARVMFILAKYAFLGVIPVVIPPLLPEVFAPIQRIEHHNGKDLGYIQLLAQRVGYKFYVEPGPAPGASIAYWGPEIKVGLPQPALNVNMDVHTNVDSLSFTYDTEQKVMPILIIHNRESGIPLPIPIPEIPFGPPLAAVPPIPKNFEFEMVSHLSPISAILKGLAKANETADATTGRGSLDVFRYGHILKPRRIVGVRGAGTAFDGLYYIKSVTHKIKRGEYKQDFELIRNGLISTTPRVLP